MKKLFVVLSILSLSRSADACDYCNCYVGLDPQYKRSFIGVRQHASLFKGSHQSDEELLESGITSATFRETRTTYELHGQFFPVPKIQLLAFIPYSISDESVHGTVSETFNSQITHGNHTHVESVTESREFAGSRVISGVGDPLLIAHYQLWNSLGEDSTDFSNRFLAGAGVKFPMGNWRIQEGEDPMERLHEPGTGSWDFLISSLFIAQKNKTGFRIQANYLFAGTNGQSFRFGNKLNVNMTVLHHIGRNKFSFYPNAGLFWESSSRDQDGDRVLNGTGGAVLFTQAGCDIYLGRVSLHTAIQLPVIQELNETQPRTTWRLYTGLSYSIN